MKRILAAILALAMLLAIVGCAEQKPQPTTTAPIPETTVPGAEQFAQIYADALEVLTAQAVTLDVKQTQSMQVEEQLFVTEREQVVAYNGDGTVIRMEENVKYSEEEEEEKKEDEEEATSLYTEVYTDGTLYVELEEAATFQGALSAEDAALRYVPVALLDASLYSSITMETVDGLQKISFADPTAAEAWAMPAQAQLVSASGLAEVTAEGAVSRMQYAITYAYGTVEITREVEATPRAEAVEVAVPEDAEDYTKLTYVLALYDVLAAEELLEKSETLALSNSVTYYSYAGGVQYNMSDYIYMHGLEKDMIAKIEQSVSLHSTEGSKSYETESIYKDGKLTTTTDEGLPTTQSGVKPSKIRDTIVSNLEVHVADPEFWQDVTLTEVGSKYLLEFTYTEDYGNNMQNAVCTALFDQPTVLNQIASAYENKEISGYLGVEKYTGLALSSGVYFEGMHTIEGEECKISFESNQSLEAPCYDAYHEITDEYPEDPEPENKATPLFYKVTGNDGQQMWLLGTIHIGDNRTAYLPQEIYDAVASSDALALEIDNDTAEDRIENDEKLQAALYKDWYYEGEDTAEKHLDEELYKTAVQHMKASGAYTSHIDHIKVGLWETMLSQHLLGRAHTLRYSQGMEDRLTRHAKENEVPIWEVEDFVEHTNLFVNCSEELQILLLEEVLETDVLEYAQETQDMYELWCAGDEAALREMVNEDTDTSEFTEEELAEYEASKPQQEEYDKILSYDRNELMLKVAKQYLESGDVVFFAVGLAHLLDDTNGLVDALRDAGYTVEIVTYQ